MMEVAVKQKFITDDCKSLFQVFDDIDEMLDYIEEYDPEDVDLSKVKIR